MNKNNITLYNFAGSGDVINFTHIPRLIKNKKPNCFIRICCRSRDKCFFETNPFINDLYCIDDDNIIAPIRYKQNEPTYNNLNIWGNEVNTWAFANSGVLIGAHFNWASSRIVNMFFNEEVISFNDNLLPEFFYTKEERDKIQDFIENNKPYVVLELEAFSGQYKPFETFATEIAENIKNSTIKVFSSFMRNKCKYPFRSLNNYNLKEIGLIIEGSECFYGIASGMSCASFERTINPNTRRVIDYIGDLESITRHNKMNITQIETNTMASYFVNDIKSYIKPTTKKKPRILIIAAHPTYIKEEGSVFMDAGAEIIPTTNVSDMKSSFWYNNCSLPDDIIQTIQNDYHNVDLINKYIDCVVVPSDITLANYYLRNSNKHVIFRAFGHAYSNVYTSHAISSGIDMSIFNSDKYIWSPICSTISRSENSNIKNNEYILRGFASESRLKNYRWLAENSKLCICEVLSEVERGFYKILYDKFIKNYNGIPRIILGRNKKHNFSDSSIVGTTDDDTYYDMMCGCRLLVYTGETNLHLHYHPVEAMSMGIPVLYNKTSLIAYECNEFGLSYDYQKQIGMYSTIEESKMMINNCFNNINFAKELSEKQKIITTKIYSKEESLKQAKKIIEKICV